MISFPLSRTRIEIWKKLNIWFASSWISLGDLLTEIGKCGNSNSCNFIWIFCWDLFTRWLSGIFPCKDYSGMQKKRLTFIALNKFSTKLFRKTQCTGQGYVNGMLMFKVAFSFESNINQSARSTLDWLLKKPIRIDWVLYKHHWELLIYKKITPMKTHPIETAYNKLWACRLRNYITMIRRGWFFLMMDLLSL